MLGTYEKFRPGLRFSTLDPSRRPPHRHRNRQDGRGVAPCWIVTALSRLLAELHHCRAARIRVAGGGAGAGGTPLVGSAPDAQASALGLPHGQPQPPKPLSPSWDTTNHGGVQRGVSSFQGLSESQGHILTPGLPHAPKGHDMPARGIAPSPLTRIVSCSRRFFRSLPLRVSRTRHPHPRSRPTLPDQHRMPE